MTSRERRTFFERLYAMREAYAQPRGNRPHRDHDDHGCDHRRRAGARADLCRSRQPGCGRRHRRREQSPPGLTIERHATISPRLRAPSRCGPASAGRSRRTCPCRGPWPRTSPHRPAPAGPSRRPSLPWPARGASRWRCRSSHRRRSIARRAGSGGEARRGSAWRPRTPPPPRSTLSSRIANSSPLWRPTTSPSRTRARQALSDAAQDVVAGRVPERVVDALEVVKVHEQEGDASRLAPLPREGALEVIAQQDAVGEAGQRIVERVVDESRLQPLAVRRVDEQALRDPLAAPRVVSHRERLVADPDLRAVAGQHPVLGPEGLAGPPMRVVGRDRRGTVVRDGCGWATARGRR